MADEMKLGFVERQFRTLGFLVTVAIFVALVWNAYLLREDLLNLRLFLAIVLAAILMPTAYGLVKYYPVPGTKFHDITTITIAIGIIYIFVY